MDTETDPLESPLKETSKEPLLGSDGKVSKDLPSKKVPQHLLEKRRLGRIKAAEEFAKKLKIIGIERRENDHIAQPITLKPVSVINQKNYSSNYLKNDDQIFYMRERKHLRQQGQTTGPTPAPTASSAYQLGTPALEDENIGDPNALEDDELDSIIIHPGSSFIKIGPNYDIFPLQIPNLVAVPTRNGTVPSPQHDVSTDEAFSQLKESIQFDFKERMRFYKRRIMPNSNEQAAAFNSRSDPELVPDLNDYGRIEWIKDRSRSYYGNDAMQCLPSDFDLRSPFLNGSFNFTEPSYNSFQELLSDVEQLIVRSLATEKVGIERNQFSNYRVVLIVPDLFDKKYVESMIHLLLIELNFQSIAIIQESLASCYGAGLSNSTCVIDIGAKQTKLACVDDGVVVKNSALRLNYGGDDITSLFAHMLLQNKFPYPDWNINEPNGWTLAETLKKQCITFQDADIAIQLYSFIKRDPYVRKYTQSHKYDFKLFDEVMCAPMGLFFPEIFQAIRSKQIKPNEYVIKQCPSSKDIYTLKPNDTKSLTHMLCVQEPTKWYSNLSRDIDIVQKLLNLDVDDLDEQIDDNSSESKDENHNNEQVEDISQRQYNDLAMPLEKAIIESITNASMLLGDNMSKMNVLYSNILIVGGSSKIPALDFILTDRINIWRPKLLSISVLSTLMEKIGEVIKTFETENKAEVETTDPQAAVLHKKNYRN
ncbi:unnamed protein product [Kluyveromyces dobzhanskii CBS 2104]|uniref:WGS project CCBQ000000000 data, contig 00106 n=1 Tax=Kluyveromyces dobzhanskii CBS 2104 TaxID=1427455 RepID=A0A0A8L5F5_9SACH|nr:unnamed protein product [Kluyveromyces dobzhanskii CBS 2104]